MTIMRERNENPGCVLDITIGSIDAAGDLLIYLIGTSTGTTCFLI